MDDRLDAARAGLPGNSLHGLRVVIQCGLIEVPVVGLEVDAGPPVFQPHVIAVLYQVVNYICLHRGAENASAHPGTMYEQNGPLGRRTVTLHPDKVAPE